MNSRKKSKTTSRRCSARVTAFVHINTLITESAPPVASSGPVAW